MSANSASLAASAYAHVRRRIMRGEMSIGESVSRRKVAAELGMSFLPVSEALLRLEFEGMLESRPRAGTRVRIPSREDVQGHYLVREILEAEAARRFAAHATRSERAGLMRMAARVDALAVKKGRGPYLAMHHRLHSRIAECARCRALSNVIEQTCALSSTWFCLLPRPEAPLATHRHRDLAKVLTSEPPDEAADFMREHVRYSMREALERLKPYFKMRKVQGATFFRSARAQARQLKRGISRRG
ncbi:MAG TPA: GntR family transcriptional regulator [Vicinamibacterales bacterium]|nr:GntR family transcriptional regulator [Vicinamibacterales bacterium]